MPTSLSRKCRWWAVCPVVLSQVAACAQMTDHLHSIETEDQTNPAQLTPPRAMKGIGNASLEITATPDAQRWFNQGLNLLHDFWDYESARAFEESIRADPQCAMCYWGLYRALVFFHGNNQGYAPAALARAVELKPHVTERERLYIDATAANFRTSAAIWRQLVQKYPADDEAKIFLANALGRPQSIELLREVLKRKPDDSAANHYLIHALESSENPADALASARVLARLAPNSGHMVHMPGHVYFVLGDYERAERCFQASQRVDERYMRQQNIAPDDDWNYVHNLMYLIEDLMEQGKLTKAQELSARTLPHARGRLESTLYIYQFRDSVSRIDPQLPIALRTGDWPQVQSLVQRAAIPSAWIHLHFLSQQLGRFASAMQAYQQKNCERGDRLRAEFDTAQKAAIADSQKDHPEPAVRPARPQRPISPDALPQSFLQNSAVLSLEMQAWSQALSGNVTEAEAAFNRAAEEKHLGYHEPPAYFQPVRESEGVAFLLLDDYSRARDAYRAALLQRPNSGFALYGIALSFEKENRMQPARQAYVKFLDTWRHADRNLPEMIHAKRSLSKAAA